MVDAMKGYGTQFHDVAVAVIVASFPPCERSITYKQHLFLASVGIATHNVNRAFEASL